MIPVSDILKRTKALLGNCRDDEAYATLTEAVRILGNKGDFDPLLGVVDIAVTGRVVALPSDVETVLAVNIDKIPVVGRDRYFNFHLNGPGDSGMVDWSWQDNGVNPLFSDPDSAIPEEFYAYAKNSDDAGKILRIFGFDENGDVLRTEDSPGVWNDGIPVTLLSGGVFVYPFTQLISRVTRISKPDTVGPVVVVSYLRTTSVATVRGVYQYDENEPQYRRITLAVDAKVCRVAYRKKSFKLTKLTDVIPLYSESPVLTMVQSIKALREERFADSAICEATALRHLSEEHENRQPPVKFPMQFNTEGTPFSGDQLD